VFGARGQCRFGALDAGSALAFKVSQLIEDGLHCFVRAPRNQCGIEANGIHIAYPIGVRVCDDIAKEANLEPAAALTV
jgi:hypothetical protein